MLANIKRQAEIISKETGLAHSKALELAARLNRFKNYHQATEAAKQSGVEGDFRLFVVDDHEGFEVKIKRPAEVRRFVKVPDAKTPEEALTLAQELLDSGTLDDTGKWEVVYLYDDMHVDSIEGSSLTVV